MKADMEGLAKDNRKRINQGIRQVAANTSHLGAFFFAA